MLKKLAILLVLLGSLQAPTALAGPVAILRQDVAEALSNLERANSVKPSPRYQRLIKLFKGNRTIRKGSSKDCGGENPFAGGYKTAFTEPHTAVYICPGYFEGPPEFRAQLLLHEFVHLDGTLDECTAEKVSKTIRFYAGASVEPTSYDQNCGDFVAPKK